MRLIKKIDLEELQWYKKQYSKLCEEYQINKNILSAYKKLISNLEFKLKGTKSIVYAVKNDLKGNSSFICLQDRRALNTATDALEGDLNLFVLSTVINPEKCPEKYRDMPYLQSSFRGEQVKIYELHSDIDGEQYEKHGYATMLLDALIEIAQKANSKIITGTLSLSDADTETKKKKRNSFYKKYKTAKVELFFDDETERQGSLQISL